MSTRTWHKGPPPFPAWWNASKKRDIKVWRWHDGRAWSCPMMPGNAKYAVKHLAALPDPNQEEIEWTDYWPENARVPRVDPRSKT